MADKENKVDGNVAGQFYVDVFNNEDVFCLGGTLVVGDYVNNGTTTIQVGTLTIGVGQCLFAGVHLGYHAAGDIARLCHAQHLRLGKC